MMPSFADRPSLRCIDVWFDAGMQFVMVMLSGAMIAVVDCVYRVLEESERNRETICESLTSLERSLATSNAVYSMPDDTHSRSRPRLGSSQDAATGP